MFVKTENHGIINLNYYPRVDVLAFMRSITANSHTKILKSGTVAMPILGYWDRYTS